MKSGSASGDEAVEAGAGFECSAVVADVGADNGVAVAWVAAGDGVSTFGELADAEGWVADDAGMATGAGDLLEAATG